MSEVRNAERGDVADQPRSGVRLLDYPGPDQMRDQYKRPSSFETLPFNLPKIDLVDFSKRSLTTDYGTVTIDMQTGAARLFAPDGEKVIFSYRPSAADEKFVWSGDVLTQIVTPDKTYSYDDKKEVWSIVNKGLMSDTVAGQTKVHCAHFKSGQVEQTYELTGAVTVKRLADQYQQFLAEARVINAYLTPSKIAELQAHFELREDSCPAAYLDSRRIPTVGIGFNLIKDGARQRIAEVGADYDTLLRDASCPAGKKQTQLSPEQISALFQKDLLDATRDAVSLYPDLTGHPQKVQDVLVDLSFNMGGSKLREFERFNAAIGRHDYKQAAAYLAASRYAEQTGTRAEANIAALRECGDR